MAERHGPYRNTRFVLEINDIQIAGFSECTLPDNTTEPIEYREGNDPPTTRKLWSLNKYGTLTLKRGTTDSTDLFEWRKLVEEGKIEEARRSVTLRVADEQGNYENTPNWNFTEAWPSKYDAPDFNATGNEVAIETLEIVHEGMERVA